MSNNIDKNKLKSLLSNGYNQLSLIKDQFYFIHLFDGDIHLMPLSFNNQNDNEISLPILFNGKELICTLDTNNDNSIQCIIDKKPGNKEPNFNSYKLVHKGSPPKLQNLYGAKTAYSLDLNHGIFIGGYYDNDDTSWNANLNVYFYKMELKDQQVVEINWQPNPLKLNLETQGLLGFEIVLIDEGKWVILGGMDHQLSFNKKLVMINNKNKTDYYNVEFEKAFFNGLVWKETLISLGGITKELKPVTEATNLVFPEIEVESRPSNYRGIGAVLFPQLEYAYQFFGLNEQLDPTYENIKYRIEPIELKFRSSRSVDLTRLDSAKLSVKAGDSTKQLIFEEGAQGASSQLPVILGATLGSLFLVLILIFLVIKRKQLENYWTKWSRRNKVAPKEAQVRLKKRAPNNHKLSKNPSRMSLLRSDSFTLDDGMNEAGVTKLEKIKER